MRLLEPLCHDMSDWWRAVSYIVIFLAVVCTIFGGAQRFLVDKAMEWIRAHTFGVWRHQMALGGRYMKSLKDSDLPPWIERTQRLLAEWNPGSHSVGAYGLGTKPVPAELQQLGIIRIDILQDQVRYVWMGGMDHTALEVDRLADGSFKFIAHYNDYKSEVIWPKRPNQSMKPTRPLQENLSEFATTPSRGLSLSR